MSEPDREAIGFASPPKASRFQKGRSGNPRGRPRGKKKSIPYDHVLGQMVTIREEGRERRVTAAEAFLLQLTKKGIEGCGPSARASLAAIEHARSERLDQATGSNIQITIRFFGLCCIVEDFGMALRLHPTNQEKVCLKLKPWIVQAAVDRLARDQLNHAEQVTVVDSTQAPDKVRWPDWWLATP